MLTVLLDQLTNPAPDARIEALYALVMLEETEVLGALREMWANETHPEVRKAIAWAGKEIYAAQQRGYTTAAAMAEAFRLDRKPDEKELEEKRLLKELQSKVNIERMKQHGTGEDNIGKFARDAAAAGALGLAFGLGAGAMLGAVGPRIDSSTSLSDGSSDEKPRIGQEPITPARPTNTDIGAWLKRLTGANPQTRLAAIVQLRDFNNPAALGPLGTRFATDSDPAVRQAAQQTGKLIYFSALYWRDRDAQTPPKPQKTEPDVNDILAKAVANKQKRATRQ